MVSTKELVDTMKLESTKTSVTPQRVTRNGRRYFSAQYKRQVVEQCLVPGASVAGVALEHGFNANLVRKWIGAYQRGAARGSPSRRTLVPVTVREAAPVAPVRKARRKPSGAKRIPKNGWPAHLLASAEIRIEIGAARIVLPGTLDRDVLHTLIEAIVAAAR